MPFDRDALFGKTIASGRLKLPKTRAVAEYGRGGKVPYVRLVECRQDKDGNETVILALQIQLAQNPVHPIEPTEMVAVTFKPEDKTYPETVSMREDFPQVPHLNLREAGNPKSFCLYVEPYAELKMHWTAHQFVERIRYWLAKTADNVLHPKDQILEPLLTTGFATLVVPEDLLTANEGATVPYYVAVDEPTAPRSVWKVLRPKAEQQMRRPPTHVAMVLDCPPQTHGTITSIPTDLEQLNGFFMRVGFDLIGAVHERLAEWKVNGTFEKVATTRPFLIFNLPKRRSADTEVEITERAAFLCVCTVDELGHQLDNFQLAKSHQGQILIPESVQKAANIHLLPFDVTLEFSTSMAARLNGIIENPEKFCILGAGALGSQLLGILLRSAYGRWTAIDQDRLLPHNLARHLLTGHFVGGYKAEAVCSFINDLYPQSLASPIVANLLDTDDKSREVLSGPMSEAVIALDCTASVPIARCLASSELPSKRVVSMFLNPTATALIVLAEDGTRACRVDWLEMQYYRAIVRNPFLYDHLRTASTTRYSNACRDLTSNVPEENVALFSSIGSKAFREMSVVPDASISIWTVDSSMRVERIDIRAEPVIIDQVGGWTICTDFELLHAVGAFRLLRLPNETGGVLLGSYDMQRRIIYVVDMIPSPVDSEEWPSAYIRGSAGLTKAVSMIAECTLQNLDYIAEWHSHPKGTSVGKSTQDETALREITGEMAKAGAPGLMMIVGDPGDYAFYIG